MSETIYTIPINEAFDRSIEEKKGCPFCRLYDKFENDELDLILGGSMMEPDVRIKTNKSGFCRRHFDLLMGKKNRLGLALMLESHLNELKSDLKGGAADLLKGAGSTACARIAALEKTCYLCARIDYTFARVLDNAVRLWKTDAAFRKKLDGQSQICLSHLRAWTQTAKKELSKKDLSLFYKQASAPVLSYLEELSSDVSWFCKKFDYRYDEEPWGNSKDAVERAVSFLAHPDPDAGEGN
ncbi:MAG: hypothetical protein IJU52_08255 [Clostridia bacterium]|nr:hypothetical protein [Clostridia bacterium]